MFILFTYAHLCHGYPSLIKRFKISFLDTYKVKQNLLIKTKVKIDISKINDNSFI